ncbi:hypothetical protein [Nannocystis pusilla]|uniref:hypothetical protein n=1 Tax=Nannocystis pusilla TaxID=889268 RepID=UPI003B7A4B6B
MLLLGHLRRALREQPRGSQDVGPGEAAGAFAEVLRAWAERLPETERQGLLQRAPAFAGLSAARSGTGEPEPRKDEPADDERSLYEAFQLRDRDARWTALKRLAGPDDEKLRHLYRRVQGTEFELPDEILGFPVSALDRELWSERIRAEELHSGRLPGELLLRYARLLGEHERSAVVDRGLDAIEAAHPPCRWRRSTVTRPCSSRDRSGARSRGSCGRTTRARSGSSWWASSPGGCSSSAIVGRPSP